MVVVVARAIGGLAVQAGIPALRTHAAGGLIRATDPSPSALADFHLPAGRDHACIECGVAVRLHVELKQATFTRHLAKH